MPYKSTSEANPALKGIKPPLTLAQMNLVASWADAMEKDKNGPKSPWAVAIAQFYELYEKSETGWMKREVSAHQEKYNCECIECGYRIESEEHCADLSPCPKCGGTMRRVERPGQGQPKFQFATNQLTTVRREKLDGVEYLVAPIVAIKAGVLNDELVLEEEIGKYLQAWAGRPFVVGHPKTDDGADITANDPRRLAQISIGQFFPLDFEDGKLRGELWVDTKKAKHLGGDAQAVLMRLQSGIPLEVSTAYFRDVEEKAGEYEGQPYVGIARNLRPDHVAALLHTEGACSWAAGCGTPRVNQEDGMEDSDQTKSKLRQAFETIANALKINVGGDKMDYVKSIVDDGRLGLGAEQLEGIGEDILKAFAGFLGKFPVVSQEDQLAAEKAKTEQVKAEELKAEQLATEKAKAEKAKAEELAANKANGSQLGELDEAFSDFGGVAGVKGILAGLKANDDQKKAELVGKLKANAQCAFTEDRLKAMELDDLEALHRTLSPADYRGQGGGPVSTLEKAEALKMPSLYEEVK